MLVKNPISINTEKAANKSLLIHFDGNRSELISPGLHQGKDIAAAQGWWGPWGPTQADTLRIAWKVLLYKMNFLFQKSLTTTEWPAPSKNT